MGVVSVTAGNPSSVACSAGQRLVCFAFSRGGGATFSVSPGAGGATWTVVASEATLPSNGSARRSLMVAELVPSSTFASTSFTASIGGDSVDAVFLRLEEGSGSGFSFATSKIANSGTSTVNSLATGSTAAVAPGSIFAIAAAVSRDGGTGSTVWSYTDVTPALVGGGTGNMDRYNGVGTGGGNAGSGGYLIATSQPQQTYADTITLPAGQTRMVTAAICIWSAPAASTVPVKQHYYRQRRGVR